jgi:Ca2+ transporting ATPase
LGYITVGVALIAVAVPEGLPLAVMISLAYSVQKMLHDQNFVKKLASCETMGGANNICSDKTGTLTKNQMTWTQIWAGVDRELSSDGKPSSEKTIKLIEQSVSVNSIGTDTDAQATDMAMIKLMIAWGVDYQAIRNKYLDPKNMLRYQFDSARKRMSTIITLDQQESNGAYRRIHTKGASEIILKTCSHYIDENGERQMLDDTARGLLEQTIYSYAKRALRTIGFAYKDLQAGEFGENHDAIEDGSKIYSVEKEGYTLICIAGIKDVIREEVPEAVAKCNTAGVRVRMVTGDNITTAIAIAKECGIIYDGEENEPYVCMEGPEFVEFVEYLVHKDTREPIFIMGQQTEKETIGNLAKMRIIRNKLKVLARSTPNDKYIMVTGLKQLGDIVAVTGDGTNDAPALRRADVGFAMRTGTQVAHGAADIIIQDDNFASIVKACSWGRNVFDNIRRFLQFQLAVNLVALTISFVGAVIMWKSPLQAIQLLWVNLIMDSLASLALATETPKPHLLQRAPYRKEEYIINTKMAKHILCMAIYQITILFVIVFAGHTFIPEDPDTAIITEALLTHPVEKHRSFNPELTFNGMVKSFNGEPIYEPFDDLTFSRHLTFVFNLFVLFQIFGMIGARKINDELNIFEGFFSNSMFLIVWIIIMAGQFIIV